MSAPKSGKTRSVPLPAWLAEDLRAYLGTHPRAAEPSAPLWPGRSTGGTHGESHHRGERQVGVRAGRLDWDKPMDLGTFRRRWMRPAVARIGSVPNRLRFHDLRHTYASLSRSKGTSLEDIATYLGHSSTQLVYAVYGHLFDSDAEAHADRLTRPVARVATADESIVNLADRRKA